MYQRWTDHWPQIRRAGGYAGAALTAALALCWLQVSSAADPLQAQADQLWQRYAALEQRFSLFDLDAGGAALNAMAAIAATPQVPPALGARIAAHQRDFAFACRYRRADLVRRGMPLEPLGASCGAPP